MRASGAPASASPCSSSSPRLPTASSVAHARCQRQSRLPCHAVLSKDPPSSSAQPTQPRKNPASGVAPSLPASPASSTRSPPAVDPALVLRLNDLLVREPPAPSTAHPRPSRPTPLLPPGPSVGSGQCYYFAYGSNLHRDSMLDSGIEVLSRDPAIVGDPTMHMVFRHRGGQATLMSLPEGGRVKPLFTPPGACVHGVLYRVNGGELRRLQRFKQSEWGYKLEEVEVQTYGGKAVRAWVFVSDPMALLPSEVPPTESYMRQLREGAADQFLHPAYQAWLSSIETVPSAGLPLEYWNTPAKHAVIAAVAAAVAVAAAFALHFS